MTNFATLILRKVKEIGLIATTRFEDHDLNCGSRWFKKIRIALYDAMMTSSKAWEKMRFFQKRHFFEPKLHHEGMK